MYVTLFVNTGAFLGSAEENSVTTGETSLSEILIFDVGSRDQFTAGSLVVGCWSWSSLEN